MTDDWDEESEQNDPHRFLLFWDCYGLETVLDMDGYDRKRIEAALKDETYTDVDVGELIPKLQLRARFNPQRCYEMYAVTMPDGVTEDDVREMFDANPQGMATLIRQRGLCLYGKNAETENRRRVIV